MRACGFLSLGDWSRIVMVSLVVILCAWFFIGHIFGIQEGEVFKKVYNAAYYTTSESCTSTKNGKETTTLCVPVTTYVPATYTLWIQKKNDDGKYDQNWFTVDPITYGRANEGDIYSASCGCIKEKK